MPRPLPQADLEHVFSCTETLWAELRGGRLFVTGGTGFFGRWLLETFAFANDRLALGAKLVALTRDPAAFRAKAPHLAANTGIELVAGDIRDFAFPAGAFSHVVHAAATSARQVPPLEHLDTIIQGTRRALDFAVACDARKFLLVSSGAVYGPQPTNVTHIPEDFSGAPPVTDPASAYGEGKRVAELLCAIYRRTPGLETKIARCFAFVGPHLPLDAHFAIGNFLRDALSGGSVSVNGDGTPHRSYLYAADLAVWLWTILFKGEPGRAYNVGSDESLAIAEVAHRAAALRQPPLEVFIAQKPSATALALPARYVPDTRRARIELHLEAHLPISEALIRTAHFHRTDLTLSTEH
jgi:nucleoside-diphosphate-sugar epimerase